MTLFLLCVKIFFVRIIDVSMGTFRTVLTVKGKNFFASAVGFFEVFIWFLIVKEALNTDETSIFVAVSYALGYATGTFIGGFLSTKLIKGNLNVQIITEKEDLVTNLRKDGFAVSLVDIKGKNNNKYMLILGINNNKYSILKEKILEYDKNAFVYVNETKYIQNGFIK